MKLLYLKNIIKNLKIQVFRAHNLQTNKKLLKIYAYWVRDTLLL